MQVRAHIESCDLTPAEERLWSDSRVALMWHCPAFTHILYEMLNKQGNKHIAIFTKDATICPIAATDGSSLILNPTTFFKFNLSERIFIMAHEILHCIMAHMEMMHKSRARGHVAYPDGKRLKYDHGVMNHALDYVINHLLHESKVGAMPQKDGQNVGLLDPNIATGKDSGLDVYRKLYKDKPSGKGPVGPGPGDGGGGFDEHLAPGTSQGKDPTQATQERNETEWATQIAAAANSARAQGKMPAGLDRFFKEMLEAAVDWKEKIQALFARKVGSGSFDFRRADRRLIVRDIYAPSRSGFGANCVVVGGDTSGSIDYASRSDGRVSTGDMFFAEMAGIMSDVRPKRLVLMFCDAAVHNVFECEDAMDLNTLRGKPVGGGGGTSFIPVFEKIQEMGLQPDALVYLTDGMGTFPAAAPNYPVIWGSIIKSSQYPFGDVVDIPKQAA